MPFTLSHPAAAVPFARRGLVLSALVVGSLSPDLIYFLCLSVRCQFGHTLLGLFLFDMPVGLTLLWLFHTVLKYPLLSLFPARHQQCLMPLAKTPFHFIPLRRFLLIVLSLLLGAITHIVWDSFTHSSGWMVQQFAVLKTPIIDMSQKAIKLHNILQHSSTLLGISLLSYWYYRWFRQAPSAPIAALTCFSTRTKWLIILIIGLSAGGIGSIYAFLDIFPFASLRSFEIFAVKAVIYGMTIAFIELVIFSLFLHARKKMGFERE